MRKCGNEWAIVLAAGDGTRLSVLTDASGKPVPKQFWALRGERSLLGDALGRASRLVKRERTVVIVAEKHRSHWERELATLPRENVIVQPENRGTGPGLLLPLLSILRRDPNARVLILPSDHFVADERVLASSMRLALGSAAGAGGRIVLLGISPSSPETGYGWIVPRDRSRLDRLEAFVEKPSADVASELLGRGGLWNSFLMAADGRTLLGLFARRRPDLTTRFRSALAGGSVPDLSLLYAGLEMVDFSREVLQGGEESLWLLRVPECGWTDLGTPQRVAECVESLGAGAVASHAGGRSRREGRLSLPLALQRFGLVTGVSPTTA